LKELNESAKEDPENAISDDLETPNFQKFSCSAPTMVTHRGSRPPYFYKLNSYTPGVCIDCFVFIDKKNQEMKEKLKIPAELSDS
jgi:hypothetical protein